MTFTKPERKNYFSHWLLTFAVISFLIVSLINIYSYNRNVQFQGQIVEAEKSLQELRLVNADLKNQLYQSLDSQNLDKIINTSGLIKVNPEYLEISPMVARTQ